MMKPTVKVQVAALSVLSNTGLTVMKLVTGLVTGSVSILSEAIHSSMDLIAAVIALVSVRTSDKPADREHPYGHGKIESVSGIIEGFLILLEAIFIVLEAIEKLIRPGEINQVNLGFAVMIVSALVNAGVAILLYRTAKKEDSLALEADALHLRMDVVTSAGVALGLILIEVTRIKVLDPIIAILVASLILKSAWDLVAKALDPLLDTQLDDGELVLIQEVLGRFEDGETGYHDLRTRKAGKFRFVDFHLTVSGHRTVAETNMVVAQIRAELHETLPFCNVTVQVEPLEHQDLRIPTLSAPDRFNQ